MKRLLFSLPNILVAADGMEEFEVTCKPFSCFWDVYKCSAGGDNYVQIEVSSVMSQNERGEWKKDCVPMAIIAEMEERLQIEIDAERERVRRMLKEEAAA